MSRPRQFFELPPRFEVSFVGVFYFNLEIVVGEAVTRVHS